MDLAGALAELYELPPEQFVERRRAVAAELKQAGEGELAEQVTRARRPSLTAWAVNLAFRADPARADRLAELGSALREAQATMAGDRIRDLTARRRRLLDELTTAAEAEARDHGHPLAGSARQEVADTLTAALVSEDALAAATSGILTRSLSYAGFGDVDVTAATATPLAGRRAGDEGAAGAGTATARATKTPEAPEQAEEAEQAAERARAADRARRVEALGRAERTATRAGQALGRAEERAAALARQVDELRELLQARSEELAAAQEAVRQATAAARQAGQELAEAQQALETKERP